MDIETRFKNIEKRLVELEQKYNRDHIVFRPIHIPPKEKKEYKDLNETIKHI